MVRKSPGALRSQYAAVGAASRASLSAATTALQLAAERNPEVEPLLGRTRDRASLADKFVASYQRYCWPVRSVDDLKLAPFHLLASEGKVHTSQDHRWHMETLDALCAQGSPLLVATDNKVIDLTNPRSEDEGSEWWMRLTERGGEGMVVKPLNFIERGRRSLAQPAVKCRGPEYLRIIYGPEYTLPENLDRLRARGLSVKRSLALREVALGIEALERFARVEPLRRVHECVFAVLALESEPVDPRL